MPTAIDLANTIVGFTSRYSCAELTLIPLLAEPKPLSRSEVLPHPFSGNVRQVYCTENKHDPPEDEPCAWRSCLRLFLLPVELPYGGETHMNTFPMFD